MGGGGGAEGVSLCGWCFYGLFFTRAIPKGLTFGYEFKILCIMYIHVCFVLFFSQS